MDKLKPLHDYGERQRLAYGIFGRLKKKQLFLDVFTVFISGAQKHHQQEK